MMGPETLSRADQSQVIASSSKSTTAPNPSKAATQAIAPAKNAAFPEWVEMFRPSFDIQKEYYQLEIDKPEAARRFIDKEFTCPSCDPDVETCVCPQRTKPPGTECGDDWVWQITKAGEEAYRHWLEEQEKRDQDAHDAFLYASFNGEGIIEVMENQIFDFAEEFKEKKTRTIFSLWAKVEGIIFWLMGDMFALGTCEDPKCKVAHLCALYGTLLLNMIDFLIEKREFHADSNIKNLGLILALYLQFAQNGEADSNFAQHGETDWVRVVQRRAEEHGVAVAGPFGIAEKLQMIKKEAAEDKWETTEVGWAKMGDGYEGPKRSWVRWALQKDLKAYSKRARGALKVTGTHYVVEDIREKDKKRVELQGGGWTVTWK